MAAADPATSAAGAALFSSRFSFRHAVSPTLLRLPYQPPPLQPSRLRLRASTIVALHKRNPKRLKYAAERQFTRGDAGMLRVKVEPSGEDFWKLDPVIDLIHRGGVGVIPTDTVYSIVCDLSNNDSIERLRRLKGIGDSKDFLEVPTKGKLTFSAPSNVQYLVLHVQYTFILPATKQFPKQCIKHGRSTRYAKRKQVGVRIPDDPICQAILQNLDGPLICTSVKYLSEDEWILDPVTIADVYEPLGLDFIVDGGVRIADPSTVVDMTGTNPTIIRQGKGPKLDWMVTEDKEHETESMLAFKAA